MLAECEHVQTKHHNWGNLPPFILSCTNIALLPENEAHYNL